MSGCLQNREMNDKAASFDRRGGAASPFSVFLVQELADAADYIVAFVGHLCVEVDVSEAQFLGIHAGDEVLHVAVVAMAFAEHDNPLDAPCLFEHEGVGLAPFGFVGLLRTALVELELVGGEAGHFGDGHILADVVLCELSRQDFAEVNHPFRVGSFLFSVMS